MAKMYKQARQRGAVLLVGLIILMVAMAAGLTVMFGQRMADARREAVTANALAQAKSALLGYAWSSSQTAADRPGDLPCPDLYPLGDSRIGTPGSPALPTCSGNAMGRLPWKTLGLPDLRDGWGERLWYAVSFRHKKSPRYFPLNPDTAYGQISLRASDGSSYLYRAATPPETGTGAVALIIAPGPLIRRNNNLQQNRTSANYLNPQHYLDCWGTAGCNIEDNANFVNDSSGNGFVMGPIRSGSRDIVNDRIVAISRDEMLAGMLKRVAASVASGVEGYFANSGGKIPAPAAISDTSCLGAGKIINMCLAATVLPDSQFGRIPTDPIYHHWNISPAAQILNGDPGASWFQRNAWREFVFYAIAPACVGEVAGCAGSLTVNNPPHAATTGKRAVVIVSGAALTGQQRVTNADKSDLVNYLEEENRQNMSALDSVFARRPASPATSFNDAVATVPRLP